MTDWGTIGGVVGVTSAVLGANAFLMKLVIGSEINKALLGIADKYLTKTEFEKHIEHCPNLRRIQK